MTAMPKQKKISEMWQWLLTSWAFHDSTFTMCEHSGKRCVSEIWLDFFSTRLRPQNHFDLSLESHLNLRVQHLKICKACERCVGGKGPQRLVCSAKHFYCIICSYLHRLFDVSRSASGYICLAFQYNLLRHELSLQSRFNKMFSRLSHPN